jgi:hypothetical protein
VDKAARDEESLRAEIEDHIDLQTADNLPAGMTAIEARRQALLKFGGVDAIKESYHGEETHPQKAPRRHVDAPACAPSVLFCDFRGRLRVKRFGLWPCLKRVEIVEFSQVCIAQFGQPDCQHVPRSESYDAKASTR